MEVIRQLMNALRVGPIDTGGGDLWFESTTVRGKGHRDRDRHTTSSMSHVVISMFVFLTADVAAEVFTDME